MDTHTKELDYLLTNYWCVKELNPKEYFNIKNNLDYYKNLIYDKLNSNLIVKDRFIKLEKIPSTPKIYHGLDGITNTLEYVLLLIILLYLEDKPKLEQFILSNLIDYITNTSTTLNLNNIPDWTIYHHRKCLVTVIDKLEYLGIIKIVDKNNTFTEDIKAEALYESTGISNYFVREFKGNIQEYTNFYDFLNDEFKNQDTSIGDVRRYKVYRHLLYSLVSHTEDLTKEEKDYIRKFRNNIKTELEKYINGELEITKNMSLIMYDYETRKKHDFPNTKAISDIVLLINNYIYNELENGKLSLDEEEKITLPKEEFYRIIKETKKENLKFLSKEHREKDTNNFINEIISYMKTYEFIKEQEENIILYPIIFRMIGYIPKETEEQLNLFGGE